MGDFTENTDIKLEKRLINNLPEHYREHDNVQQLFSALGKYLDELREEIHNVQYYNDSDRNSESNLIRLSEQYGVNLPRNLSRSRRRQIVRDVVSFYQIFGTESAIRLMFRLIGLGVEIEYIFIESGQKDQEFIYPADYYFGNDFVDPDDGKIKAKVEDQAGTEYNKCKIYGEKYNEDDDTLDLELIRCPYIKVTITAEDYDLFTESYIGKEDVEYTYTEQDKFQIVQDIIEYFYDFGRPANVAIIELTTVNENEFELDPNKYINHAVNIIDEPSETLQFNEVSYDHFAYMDVDVDHFSPGYTIANLTWDDWNDNLYLTSDPDEQTITREYKEGSQGIQLHFPLRQNTDIEIDGPSDMDITLQTSNEPRYKIINNIDEELENKTTGTDLFDDYMNISSSEMISLHNYMTARININEPLSSKVILKVHYKSPDVNQEVYQ